MQAPNALSLFRVALVPLVVIALLWDFPAHQWIAAALFVVASITDLLDGRIARASGNVTVFGTFIDSLADKLLICCTLIALVELNRVWGWVAMVVVAREFAVTGLRLVAAQDEVISASRSGKAKMILQVVAVLALILDTRYQTLNDVLVILMVIATVVSGVEYFVNGRRHLTAGISR
ncbi:MAG: CDP-diacylglycerol--glycerol-3-phosphate 3-phosphatidyltransferase [Gaiellales bacterium]